MKMEKIILGWSDGIELTGKNVSLYKDEIVRSIKMMLMIQNKDVNEDVILNMLKAFERMSDYFPNLSEDLIYSYSKAQKLSTIDINYNLCLYLIMLYDLYIKNNGGSEGLLDLRIEYGFIDVIRRLSDAVMKSVEKEYDRTYALAKEKAEEWFERYSEARSLIEDGKIFKGFLVLKADIRSAIVSDLIKHDTDKMIIDPKDMDLLVTMSAIMSEVIAILVLQKKYPNANFSFAKYYFEDIRNNNKYEIIKTR